jgi:small subunit ribosomal protein S5
MFSNLLIECSHLVPGERLWKGVTSVSNAGRKRGRGKAIGKKNIRNLNRGQVIGVGKDKLNN